MKSAEILPELAGVDSLGSKAVVKSMLQIEQAREVTATGWFA